MGPPDVLAFHLGDASGGAHRVTWDGTTLRYARFRDGFEKVLEKSLTPAPGDWAAFGRSIARVDPFAWTSRYEGAGEGERWSLELVWDGRAVRASGEAAHPPEFTRLKLALWSLLDHPPSI